MSQDNVQLLGTFGKFGYTFFVFLSGVKMDMSMVTRVGSKSCYLAIISILVPILYAVSSIVLFSNNQEELTTILYLSPLFYMTSFLVIHCLLTELKILNSELGRLAHSTTIIADFLSFFSGLGVIFALDATKGAPAAF